MSKKDKATKSRAYIPSNFVAEVARSAAKQKFIWDSLEDLYLETPSTLELLEAAKKFGWPREKVLNMRLSQVAVHLGPASQG